ncbi:NFATC2-interacting protein isoform X2 [Thamnophis elegans]|uniref:NFATC2-interacting protein isoform X2 n=1 Tax=Thamnophis elegans TaxID=35005 RepID=UPI001378E15B|nr:NFATC2-interacting protein isoform X2 [Thamnophis elegans]
MEEPVTLSSDSEPEGAPKKPLPKRRRILTESVAIPVYSTQVENSLKLLQNSMKLPDEIKERCSKNLSFSSEEDEDEEKPVPLKQLRPRPSRPFDQSLRNLNNSLSAAKKSLQDQRFDEDDVILVDAFEPQELLLKVRCRADLHKVCILMTEPLRRVVDHMAQILKVHPNRIILLHHDSELSADATPAKLDLGVASIIDCIVESNKQANESGNLLLRVQGKDRSSVMDITVQKGEPLETLMNNYKQGQGQGKGRLVFYFDGQRLTETQTPEQLGMESGDVIEVWN